MEIAIIGGGVIGLSCAWRLAQGGANVALFERLQTGREASWAAAGMLAPSCEATVHPWNCGPEAQAQMEALCFASRDLYPAFAAELQEKTGLDVELCLRGAQTNDWREPGILFVAPDADDARLKALSKFGEPGQNENTIWLPDDGQVATRKLVAALREAALKAGVTIHENRLIRRFVLDNNKKIVGLAGETEEWPCEAVLLCAGAWSGKIAGLPNELKIPVKPLAGQVLVLRGEKRVKSVIYGADAYLVPRRDGRLLVGATVENVGFSKRVTAGGIAQLLNAAIKLVPELAEVPLETSWAGLRPASPDDLPILGATPIENLWLATGHGRNGILLAPATAQLMADCLLNQKPVPPHFGFDRFSSDETHSSQRSAAPNGSAHARPIAA